MIDVTVSQIKSLITPAVSIKADQSPAAIHACNNFINPHSVRAVKDKLRNLNHWALRWAKAKYKLIMAVIIAVVPKIIHIVKPLYVQFSLTSLDYSTLLIHYATTSKT